MQILINGTIQGLTIALMAIGFSVVYNSTGILNVAQGAVFAVAPYLLLAFNQSGFGMLLAATIVLASTTIISTLYEVANHRQLYNKGASSKVHFMASLGVYIAIIQVISMIWGNETVIIQEYSDTSVNLWRDTLLTRPQLIGATVSLIAIACFFILLKKTNYGLKLIALSDNPVQLSLMGYKTSNMRLLAFGVSGLITGLTSLLVAIDTGFDPHGGLKMVLLAMVATIIGGNGTFTGPVLGGLLLGILRTQIVWYTSAKWEDAISFLILVGFLFFRPQGIVGEAGRTQTT